MSRPTRDQILTMLQAVHDTEGLEAEPDETMVDAIAHLFSSPLDWPNDADPNLMIPLVGIACRAFVYGQTTATRRIIDWCVPSPTGAMPSPAAQENHALGKRPIVATDHWKFIRDEAEKMLACKRAWPPVPMRLSPEPPEATE